MSEKSHILVLDDEKNYLLVLQTLLEDEGYTVRPSATRKPRWRFWTKARWTWW